MNVNPLHNAQSIARAYGTKPAAKPTQTAAAGPARGKDSVELGTVNRLISHSKANDVRWNKVNEIKAQIANGNYETDDKLDAAADKLLDDVA